MELGALLRASVPRWSISFLVLFPLETFPRFHEPVQVEQELAPCTVPDRSDQDVLGRRREEPLQHDVRRQPLEEVRYQLKIVFVSEGGERGLPVQLRQGRSRDDLELVELTHRRNDPVERLSRGMKQRLSLARTLIHDPQVLILDEPASGLDPRARVEIRELLVELARMGKTIFFSTHILADVAEICTQVAIIEAGKLVASGALEELQKMLMPHRVVQLTVLGKADQIQAILSQDAQVLSIQPLPSHSGRERLEFSFSGGAEDLRRLLSTLVSSGASLLHFSEDSRDLEGVFMRATKGMVT